MMKILICLALSLVIFPGNISRVYALDPAPEKIEEHEVTDFTLDAQKDRPVEQLIPKPTPAQDDQLISPLPEDTRSWTKSEYQSLIKETAEKYRIDPQLIYATIMTESEGDKYAFRYEPAIKDASLCLGQILVSTARMLGFSGEAKRLYKPTVCIDLIGKYHRLNLDTYGELTPQQLAQIYNSGSLSIRAVYGHIDRFNKWFYEG